MEIVKFIAKAVAGIAFAAFASAVLFGAIHYYKEHGTPDWLEDPYVLALFVTLLVWTINYSVRVPFFAPDPKHSQKTLELLKMRAVWWPNIVLITGAIIGGIVGIGYAFAVFSSVEFRLASTIFWFQDGGIARTKTHILIQYFCFGVGLGSIAAAIPAAFCAQLVWRERPDKNEEEVGNRTAADRSDEVQ